MKYRILKTLTSLTLFSFFVITPCIFAEKPVNKPQRPDAEGRLLAISEQLNLTDEQKEQIRDKRYQEKRSRMQLGNAIQVKELDLRHELEKATPSKEVIDGIVAELKELYGARLEQRVSAVLGLRKILTPEQYEKFKVFGKKHRPMMRRGQMNKGQYQQEIPQQQ